MCDAQDDLQKYTYSFACLNLRKNAFMYPRVRLYMHKNMDIHMFRYMSRYMHPLGNQKWTVQVSKSIGAPSTSLIATTHCGMILGERWEPLAGPADQVLVVAWESQNLSADAENTSVGCRVHI